MQIKDSRFHKVWDIEDKGNFSKVRLGDSKKDKEGNYTNCTWNAILVGKAHNMGVSQNDTINILSGQIFQDKGKDGKYYTNITIFEVEFANKEQKAKDETELGYRMLDDDDSGDVPF